MFIIINNFLKNLKLYCWEVVNKILKGEILNIKFEEFFILTIVMFLLFQPIFVITQFINYKIGIYCIRKNINKYLLYYKCVCYLWVMVSLYGFCLLFLL